MRNSKRNVKAIALLVLVLLPSALLSQCRPPKNSNEARLLAFYSVPISFSADPSTIASNDRLTLNIGGDGAYVPAASATLQHTEFCYTGRAQNTSLASVFGRPRVSLTLPVGLGFELSYLPTITVGRATPNLLSGAVWFTRRLNGDLELTFRVHGTNGTIAGAITCPASALQQSEPDAPCYGTRPSHDVFRPRMLGQEILLRRSRPQSRFGLIAGIGVNELTPRFQVGFSDLSGGTDRTTITVDLARIITLAGASYRFNRMCSASAEGYASFSDAATIRGFVSCRLLG